MAKLVLKDCYVEINAVDFSDHVSAVTVNLSKDDVETTNFSGGGRERVQGLKDDSFEVTFQQDYATGKTDAVLYPLYDAGTEFVIKVRPTAAAKGVNNPEYSGTCVLFEYAPIDGEVGKLSEAKVKFPTQRDGITRATA